MKAREDRIELDCYHRLGVREKLPEEMALLGSPDSGHSLGHPITVKRHRPTFRKGSKDGQRSWASSGTVVTWRRGRLRAEKDG